MSNIWDELVGDRVIEPPYKLEGMWINRAIFFESGKVMFVEHFAYEGDEVTLYGSVKEFEEAEVDNEQLSIVPEVVVDASPDQQKVTN